MLRRPSTAIVLGQADLDEFEQRRRNGRAIEAEDEHYEQAALQGSVSNMCLLNRQEIDFHTPQYGGRSQSLERLDPSLYTRTQFQQKNSRVLEVNRDDIHWVGEHDNCIMASHHTISEDESHESQRSSSSPSMDDFYYGGFVQRTSQWPESYKLQRSLSAVNSIGTPQNQYREGPYRTIERTQLLRSMVSLPQILPSSLEPYPTSGLTPRVNSRVATYGSPGIVFQYPPRRPGQRRQTFRHQTNSFSFDSSDRSNAAYEQNPVTSTSSAASISYPAECVNLFEELRGVSLSSSPASSALTRASHSEGNNIADSPSRRESSGVADTLFPAQIPTMRHNIPAEDLVTSSAEHEYQLRNLPRHYVSRTVLSPHETDHQSLSNPYTPMGVLRSAVRIISSYRHRNPRRQCDSPEHPSPSPTSFPTPRQSRSGPSYRTPLRTPSRSYRVYNDQLSPDGQPQTPADLPEARHRSRFHASNTAPVFRAAMRARGTLLGNDGTASSDFFSSRLPASFTTPSRRPRGRGRSPAGLLAEGFRGLYGGRENGDDEQNWVDGVRVTNAETRLWGIRGDWSGE